MADSAKKGNGDAWRAATQLIRGGLDRSQFGETCEGIFMTSGYIYPTAEDAEGAFAGEGERFIYSRFSNPTVDMFQKRMALLEGAAGARATATGMAAVFAALMCFLKAGDRVVASRALFGSCHYICSTLLPRYGIESEFVDGTNLDEWQRALSKPADAVFLETPSNPTLALVDLAAVCDLAHRAGAKVVVDNVFATPIYQKPMQFGVDVVMYSATKHIDGQGRALGGMILCDETFLEEHLVPFMRNTGPSMSPFNAWLLMKGLETLPMRVEAMTARAIDIAQFLSGRNDVRKVLYPWLPSHPQHDLAKRQMTGGSTLVSFEVPGGKEAAFRFQNSLRLIDISNNLGDAKSIITHPATTTHQRIGPEERARLDISDGLLRLSVGLEDVEDLKEDIAQALSHL
ncbi:MAG: O-succinylhomoserine sulfhydrylase [Acetobacterales bacterium]